MHVDAGNMEVLEVEECWRLLDGHSPQIGRIGFNAAERPLVLPVNYLVDHRAIVFRTEEGLKLDAASRNAPIAFEVDEVDPAWEEAWSVVIQGHAEEVTDPVELRRLRHLPLRTWVSGARAHYVRIVPEVVSGRRVR